MSLVRLEVQGIAASQVQSDAYLLVINEYKGKRKLPIVINSWEAQSIVMALEKSIKPPRPLTYDLFENFARRFDITIRKVIIHKLVDGIFYSTIICERDGIEEIIDARNSDAVALAIRFSAPIFTYESILDRLGVMVDIDKKNTPSSDDCGENSPEINFKNLPSDKLAEMLKKAVENEDYEQAASIRDEINHRGL